MFLCVTPSTKSTNFARRYFVGLQGLSERDEIWQIYRSRALLYINTQIDEVWPKASPWAAKIVKGVKIITLFSYTVWPSAMKFGTVRGLTN